MTSQRSPGTPYERGVAHLKRAEYPEAVAAFTEAIGLDPEAPNPHVGRALAYRSLGDEAAAKRDEEAAQALGGPERSAWDRLVNRAYRRWRGDLSDPAWRRSDPLSRNAVLLRQWTWQIYNGGLPQWVAHGYGQWAEDLARAAEEVGTDATRQVAAIVRDVARVLRTGPDARGDVPDDGDPVRGGGPGGRDLRSAVPVRGVVLRGQQFVRGRRRSLAGEQGGGWAVTRPGGRQAARRAGSADGWAAANSWTLRATLRP
jgi:tetratricopeptide (TPR) repeat protein